MEKGQWLELDSRVHDVSEFHMRKHCVAVNCASNSWVTRPAKVEVWHADPHGRYPHPCDLNPAELDPNFTGWGEQVTGPDGGFAFRTTKPGPYPTSTPNWWRPPHIHFQVTTANDRLVTQMYFPGEDLNDQDELLIRHQRLKQDDRVTARALPLEKGMEPDALFITFDIVLPTQYVCQKIKKHHWYSFDTGHKRKSVW